MPIRIAMWSGPRNISTALMRSFENRTDCVVSDEPFYASYLAKTDVDHPGREAILASQPHSAAKVAMTLTGPLPKTDSRTSNGPADSASRVWYQKLMAHHILPGDDLSWLGHREFQHIFLLRNPQAMLVSLRKVLGEVTAEQTGLPQQVQLFDTIRQATGKTPAVVHSEDVLADPQGSLVRLCELSGIPFEPQMLSWPAGPRPSDGVWAPHWYANVYQTTGFGEPRNAVESLPTECQAVLNECNGLYQQLCER